MNDQFAWWQDAIAGRTGPIHENDPQSGYYRMRRGKGGEWIAVAIWRDDIGQLVAVTDEGGTTQDVDPLTVWTWCCRNPVSYETWLSVTEGREPWPDDISEPPALANADPLTQIAETIEALAREASRDLDGADLVADKAARDRASNYATRLTELAKEADTERDREKRPHLEAGREIDARWRPVIERGRDEARRLKDVVGDALKAIKAKAAEAGIEAVTKAGTRGKAVSLRTVSKVVITDYRACAQHFLAMSRVPEELSDALLLLSRRSRSAGVDVPGTEVQTIEVAA
jgi:hypothetical protein